MSLEIKDHKNSKRVKVITIKESELDRLIFPFKKHTITSLEYKPFSRFTLAKSVNEVFEGKLNGSLINILNDRKTGTVIIEPEINNKKFKSWDDIVADKDTFPKLVRLFKGDVPFDWLISYYAQQKVLLDEVQPVRVSKFNRDGGFMDFISKLIRDIRVVEEALGSDEKRKLLSEEKCFIKLAKSIVSTRDLKKGEIISEEQFIDYQDQYGEDSFSAAIGAEAIEQMLLSIDLEDDYKQLKIELSETKSELKKTKLTTSKISNDMINTFFFLIVLPLVLSLIHI